MIETIRKLAEAYGPSGHEDEVRALIHAEVEGLADEVTVDALGNLVAWKRSGRQNAPVVMLTAHMDEIGLMVTHIDEKGFLRFTNVGALYPITLVGNRVRFADGTIGTIGVELKEFKSTSVPGMDKLYVDVDSGSGKATVRVGDAACIDRTMIQRGSRLIAKSMDNRIGCAILIEVLRQTKKPACDAAFVFTVQEEVGRRGAYTATYGVNPDLGIAVDVTRTGDTPNGVLMEVDLGKGPASKIKDAGMIAAPEVVALMEAAARKAKVPVQREVLEGGTTDAASMQVTRAGVRSGCLSIPCRDVHTASETVDLNDVEGAGKQLATLVQSPVTV